MGDWEREVVPQVLVLVSSRLTQRDICVIVCVNTYCRRILLSHASLWKVINLQGLTRAGSRLVSALSLARYAAVEEINLEFGQDVEDGHLKAIKCKSLKRLNLNACQKITDEGIKSVVSNCPGITHLSLYWNLKIQDAAIEAIATNLRDLEFLNVSGCKNITDRAMHLIASHTPSVKSLNITRCVKLTDEGLVEILDACWRLEELYLYALSSLTPRSLGRIGNLADLKLLELTGSQGLTDDCLASIGRCVKLEFLNLTWCVKITDAGLKALNCPSLRLLSLHGILGVTDEGLEHIASCCSESLLALDVNGCLHIKRRSKEGLLELFPRLQSFQACPLGLSFFLGPLASTDDIYIEAALPRGSFRNTKAAT